MTPREASLLERVCAEPEEDGPRLIMADWLDEQGDPRGEFIRLQCALERLPLDDPRLPEMRDLEGALLARYHAEWTKPLNSVAGWAEFRRGFIDTVNVPARQFLLKADDLFQLAPVRHIRFLDVGSSLWRLTHCPQIARLTSLTIYAQHLGEELTRCLVASPHLGRLRFLNIGRNRVGDRGVERLARSPRFRELTHLDLSDNTVGDTGVHALAESSNLLQIRDLVLRRNEVTRTGLAYLTTSQALTGLRHLGLGLNYVGSQRENVPNQRPPGAVVSVDLTENGIAGDMVNTLTEMSGLQQLQHLDLGHNEIGNPGAGVLASWSGASGLKSLSVPDNRIGDEGARALARSTYLFNLTDLDLSDNPIHDPGAFEFLNTPLLPRLKVLGLPYLGLTPKMRRAVSSRFAG